MIGYLIIPDGDLTRVSVVLRGQTNQWYIITIEAKRFQSAVGFDRAIDHIDGRLSFAAAVGIVLVPKRQKSYTLPKIGSCASGSHQRTIGLATGDRLLDRKTNRGRLSKSRTLARNPQQCFQSLDLLPAKTAAMCSEARIGTKMDIFNLDRAGSLLDGNSAGEYGYHCGCRNKYHHRHRHLHPSITEQTRDVGLDEWGRYTYQAKESDLLSLWSSGVLKKCRQNIAVMLAQSTMCYSSSPSELCVF